MTGTFSCEGGGQGCYCEGALSYVGGRAIVVRARKSHNDVLIWGAGPRGSVRSLHRDLLMGGNLVINTGLE